MKRQDVIKYFWEELNAYTLNHHQFNDGFKQLVNSSIERGIIRAEHKGKLISEIMCNKPIKKSKVDELDNPKIESAGWVCVIHNNIVDKEDKCRLCEENKTN